MKDKIFLISSCVLLLLTLFYALVISNYFIVFQSILIGVTVFCAYISYKKTNILSLMVFNLIVCFIFLSMYLGKIINVYEIIPFWDKILHFISGVILCELGFCIYDKNLDGNNKKFKVFYAIIFAIAAAGVWEIYEYTIDFLFNLTSQNNSLDDTMIDIIMGSLSAFVYAFIKK